MAPPPPRGRGRGCGAERRQWRMQRGGASAAVEKIEQASSAKIFSGTARRQGLRFAEDAVLQTVKYLHNLPHSSPPLRRGQGWWFAVLRSSAAAIKMRRRLFLSPSACSTEGFFAEKCLSYPAQLRVKRDCQGGSPVPLDRILVPFVRTKGTPRRRAVQALHPAKSMPRR